LNLEKRIAAALGEPTNSAALAELIAEIETAIPAAQEAVEQARTRMLDPRRQVDGKARQALQDALLAVDRLQASLPPLQQRAAEVYSAEELERWRPKAEALQAERDDLAQKLAALYAPFAREIVPLLGTIESLDVKIRQLNLASPDGVSHLCSVEERARGQFSAADLTITRDLKLPSWVASAVPAWPPNRSVDASLIAPMPAIDSRAFGPDWWQVARAAG
jgi:chromosome segregation ATPase